MANDKNLAFVVGDELVVAKTLALILNGNGFEAVAFNEPLKALMAAPMRCPDFLITDVSIAFIERDDNSLESGAGDLSTQATRSVMRDQTPSQQRSYHPPQSSQYRVPILQR
jgi:CheY-like chemotaxis protein